MIDKKKKMIDKLNNTLTTLFVNKYRNKVTGFHRAYQGYNERGRCVNIYGNKVIGFHRAFQGHNERGRCVNIYRNKVTGFHMAYKGI
jgi:hypothetical protein